MRVKNKSVILILIAVSISILAGLTIRDHLLYAENKFGIKGNESMSLSHLYNVNGVIGAEKTDFTQGERRKIMAFISELKYRETVPIQDETIYGVPVQLKVNRQDGSKVDFRLRDVIEVIEYDKNGNDVSKKIYTVSEKEKNKIYKILGIVRG